MDGEGVHPLHLLAVVALGLVAVTSLATAVRRSWVIFRQLANRPLDEAPTGTETAPAAEPPQQNSSSATESPRSPVSPVENDQSEKRSAGGEPLEAESSLVV
jgi:hypothetical protein